MNIEPLLPQYIDSTMLTCFRSCARKFYHEFILGLRPPRTSIDLHAGGCFASALENFYRHVHELRSPTHTAYLRGTETLLHEFGDFEVPSDSPKSLDRLIEAFHDYIAKYPPLTDHVQPYFSEGKPTFEFTFAIPLMPEDGFPLHPVSGDPFLYSGRFDMLGTYRGRPCVKDEKTAKQAGPHWAEHWDLRSQFMGYVWACQQLGIDLDTVIVRGVIIYKRDIKQLEAIKIYPRYMIDRWHEQMRRDVNRIVSLWNEGYFDYNFGDSCTSYGGCMFRSLCTSNYPENWMNEYTVRRWNPLLKNPIADAPQKEAA